MTKTLGTVVVDARMVSHSGIGVVLRGLLAQWSALPPPFRVLLLGDPALLRRVVPTGAGFDCADWNPKIYAAAAALAPPKLPSDACAWYSPHYATCLRTSLPVVCHVQDVLHITHPTATGMKLYMQGYLAALRQQARFVLTSSRHVKVQLQTLHGFQADRVLITGLGPGVVTPDPREGEVLPESLVGREYFLAVGINKLHKNWPFLLERLAKMKDEIQTPLVCLGLGKNEDDIRSIAASLGIADRLIFPGFLDDLSMTAVFRHAKALLFPSIAEGFGLPILEAMTVGKPTLIADRAPMKEIAGESAFLFDPDWPESFDEALREMVYDEKRRNEKAELGRQRAAGFSWEKTTRRVNNAIFRAVTGELPPPGAD